MKVTLGDNRMNLTHALNKLKEQYPWLPEDSIRRQVRSGQIPSIRSSPSKRAYYYVYLEDLLAALPRTD